MARKSLGTDEEVFELKLMYIVGVAIRFRFRLQLVRLSHGEVSPSVPAYLTMSMRISFENFWKVILISRGT